MAIIALTTCSSAVEANFIKTVLENEEIECFLTNENFASLMPNYYGTMGAGVQIMIDEKDSERAIALVSTATKSTETRCPNCNSINFELGQGAKGLKKAVLIMLSIIAFMPFGNISKVRICKDCGTEF